MGGVIRELDSNSLLLLNKKYINLPKILSEVTEEILQLHKPFVNSFDIKFLVSQAEKKYKQQKLEEIHTKVNEYPLVHFDWVKAQKIMISRFHSLLCNKWNHTVATRFWEFMKNDFDFEMS